MENNMPQREGLEKMSYAKKGRFFKIRNVMNTIFILLCLVGMAVYFWHSHQTGAYILVAAVVIKLSESILRIIP